MLYFGRLFTGMAAGACCTAVPIYINEIAHKSIRGALGSYYQLMVTFGIFLAYLVGKYLTSINYTLLCFCVPFGFVFSFIFAPETPTYLLKRGLSNEAKLSLTKLRGESYDVDSEINEIEGFLKEGTRIFSGVNSVIYYTSKIFVTSGANIDPQTASIIVGTVQVIATFISSLVIEKLGRRILLFVSSLIVTISLFQLAVYFTLKHRTNIDDHLLMELSFLPVASLCLFIIAFSLGLGPVPWFLTAELFPIEIKSVMASVAATFNWFFGFIVVKFYLSISGSIETKGRIDISP
ncbi:hypothetical protein NQ314_005004 [Rhamnusium bicolor]|uniref:Major facilitator superfamily (MFS) profile domain-containing protein n=1 Tax=Rhamnusium bicolor TaxID=1586634 RepID=A0AAV8ZKD6_9CUCU|nr:hypothetical protein NQ314_005004 [Rhamnusium bicolor]